MKSWYASQSSFHLLSINIPFVPSERTQNEFDLLLLIFSQISGKEVLFPVIDCCDESTYVSLYRMQTRHPT